MTKPATGHEGLVVAVREASETPHPNRKNGVGWKDKKIIEKHKKKRKETQKKYRME